MIKIKTENENKIIKAMKAEQTAQAHQKEAEAQARIKRHRQEAIRNTARKQAREEAIKEAEATPRPTNEQEVLGISFIKSYYGEAPNEADKIRYIIGRQEARETEKAQYTAKVSKLSQKSFICLYNSNRVIYEDKTLKPTTHKEDLIKFLRRKNPVIELTSNGKHKAKTNELRQVVFKTEEAKTPKALKYILSFKGEAEKATNTQTNELNKEKPILSYNNIGYEPNEIIIIGEKRQLKSIIRKFKQLNKVENQYYDFIKDEDKTSRRKTETEEEAEIKTRTIRGNRTEKERKAFLEHLLKHKEVILNKTYEEQVNYINYCLYYSYEVLEVKAPIKTKVRGLNRIRNDEKEALKKTTQTEAREETRKEARYLINLFKEEEEEAERIAEAEATNLINIALKQDKRQSIKNIEYEIRKKSIIRLYNTAELNEIVEEIKNKAQPRTKGENKALMALLNVLNGFKNTVHIKTEAEEKTEYLRTRTPTELYFIIKELEEEAEATEKTKALIRVLEAIKERKEEEEAIKQTIEEEEKEKEKQHEFKANKKNKNRYNTKIGLTTPNRKPTAKEERFKRNNENLKGLSIEKLEEIRGKTETEKKIKLNVLRHLISLKEVEEEAEERKREREAEEEETKETARRNNTRSLKRIRKIKQEVREEKAEARRKAEAESRNRPTDLIEIARGLKAEEQRKQGTPTADRIKQQAHQRNQIKQDINELYKAVYGELNTTPQEKKIFKAELNTDFKTALEIVIDESKKNIKRKYSRY